MPSYDGLWRLLIVIAGCRVSGDGVFFVCPMVEIDQLAALTAKRAVAVSVVPIDCLATLWTAELNIFIHSGLGLA